MKSKAKTILFPLLAVAVILTIFIVKRIEGPNEYINSILEKRQQIDVFMEQSPDSPFTAEQRSAFQGLSYFPLPPEENRLEVPIPAGEKMYAPEQ